ncbi:MAG: ThiF family adenylyltransferase [Cryobacterium sp.]|nr:ThiF family adenylyltransferase [Cryobacterium sp.]
MGSLEAVVAPGPKLPPERLARYSRQLALPGFDETAQRRLANARVLVIGAGGLGSAVVPYLASAGVGTIGIVDTDVVELSNLHRQTVHGMNDIGRSKLDSIADSVAALDPAITVNLHDVRLDSSNILPLLSGYDVLLDGSDNFPTRYLASDAASIAGVPLVWGAILRYNGQVGISWARKGPTFRDLFPVPPAPGTVPSCSEGGVLPSVCAVIGSIMSAETIKLVTGIGDPLIGRITTYDALSGSFREVAYRADDSRAPITELIDYETFCGLTSAAVDDVTDDRTIDSRHLDALLRHGEPIQLIDIREPFERAIVAIEPSDFLPLGRLGANLERIRRDVPVILYCHHGVRSDAALRMLREEGFENVRHLAGGIDNFAMTVAPTMARY